VKLFYDERQARHAPARELQDGEWAPYAETPSRIGSILEQYGDCHPVHDFGMDPLLAVHDADYLTFLREAHGRWQAAGRPGDAIGYTFPIRGRRKLSLERIDAALGAYAFDVGTPIAQGTWEAAYWSAQCALTALDEIAAGARHAFALCRPPGHHAGADYMGGYCYLNNAAIAARRAGTLGLGPVAILDVDYHHGNGTQDIFLRDPRVLFASIHADPATDYPFYWGHADERGEDQGTGTTLNLPLARGARWPDYSLALRTALEAIDAWGAAMMVVSFGADTFVRDPISHFALEREDYCRLGAAIGELRRPTLVVMEGGYAVSELGSNVAAFLDGLTCPGSGTG